MPLIRAAFITIGRNLMLVAITSCVAILLISVSPINPVNEFLGGNLLSVSAEQKALIAQHLGISQTPIEQWMQITQQFFKGNLGQSNYYQQPVIDVIKERAGDSAKLLLSSWLLTLLIGYSLGLLAGVKQNTLWDKSLQNLAWLLSCLPGFWLGILLMALFSLQLRWLPISGATSLHETSFTWYSSISHLVLPVTTLVLSGIGPLILHTREKVIELMSSEHVLYARIHQLPLSTLVRKYIVVGTVMPAVMIHFAAIAEIMSCSALVETVFNYPGLGNALVNSARHQDGALLICLTIFSALSIAIANMLANSIQRFTQPSTFQS